MCVAAAILLCGVPITVTATWRATTAVAVRQAFDSNLYLQDVTPLAGVSGAVAPRQESFVTTLSTSLGLDYRVGETTFALGYTPDFVLLSSASQENHRVHRGTANATGRFADGKWSLENQATWIDGSKEGPVFGGEGGAAVMGGIPVRDRRAALIARSTARLTYGAGAWFVRPLASLYIHDFLTVQSRQACYLNYIDRREILGGIDVGRTLSGALRWVAGYRLLRQDQLKLHELDSPYDSVIQRFLVGVEGAPRPWLDLTVLAGPEMRHYPRATPAGFDRGKRRVWIDATATFRIGQRDTIILNARRFAMPAFASQSIYDDITAEIVWRRKWTTGLETAAGFKAYGGQWQAPALREDWILTPSASLQYAASRRCTVDMTYAYDRAESRVPHTAGREYQRQVLSLGAKYRF